MTIKTFDVYARYHQSEWYRLGKFCTLKDAMSIGLYVFQSSNFDVFQIRREDSYIESTNRFKHQLN